MPAKTARKKTDRDRERRLRWFREARFGMFITWGTYSQLGRCEWVFNRERIPPAEYEALADTWKPKRRPAREWAHLAKKAGMKYMVMTTKHHDGFCLWDSRQTDYNAAKRGPGRDLVAEYVDACREYGLKVGLYYSLADWHHPDGWRCWSDEQARRRLVKFTHGCVRELCSDYGKIDILWYDGNWPLDAKGWESRKMNRMVREFQPGIIINNRSSLPEDFGTPEGHVQAEDRMWEACMTFNGSWGWMPTLDEDWASVRGVLSMLRTASAGAGNLLLNIGPKPDGSVPEVAAERLMPVGKWLAKHSEAVYGHVDRADGRFEWNTTGEWSLKGTTAYLWARRWVGPEIAIGGFRGTVKKITVMDTGKPAQFEQSRQRLVIKGLPKTNPDKIANVAVLKIECKSKPSQKNGPFAVLLRDAKPPKGVKV